MPPVEKVSIALPAEMVVSLREAVASGEYASASEAVREALRDWNYKRRLQDKEMEELRHVWQTARADETPGVGVDEVLDRLERKYQAIAQAAGRECA